MRILVPDILNSHVTILANRLVSDAKPQYIEHRPLSGKPLKECFPIVAEHVAINGGCSIFGWAILEFQDIWLEAEFHAIWRSEKGEFFDLTPRMDTFEKILFIPDSGKKYEGIQVASVFQPLKNDPYIIRFIELANELFVETNRGHLRTAKSFSVTKRIVEINAEIDFVISKILKF